MNPEEHKKLENDLYSAYGTQINALKHQGNELRFVVDDKEIKNLSERLGYYCLVPLKEFTVRVVRTAKNVIYILLLSAFLNEPMEVITPNDEHKPLIYEEYSQIASWEKRANERALDKKQMLSFEIAKLQPHVPEIEIIAFPPQTTLNVPISGLSTGLYNTYSGAGRI